MHYLRKYENISLFFWNKIFLIISVQFSWRVFELLSDT